MRVSSAETMLLMRDMMVFVTKMAVIITTGDKETKLILVRAQTSRLKINLIKFQLLAFAQTQSRLTAPSP